jgi:hypothetical protein
MSLHVEMLSAARGRLRQSLPRMSAMKSMPPEVENSRLISRARAILKSRTPGPSFDVRLRRWARAQASKEGFVRAILILRLSASAIACNVDHTPPFARLFRSPHTSLFHCYQWTASIGANNCEFEIICPTVIAIELVQALKIIIFQIPLANYQHGGSEVLPFVDPFHGLDISPAEASASSDVASPLSYGTPARKGPKSAIAPYAPER